MSRGPGVLQRWLFPTIRAHGKPITFAELRRLAAPYPEYPSAALERSMRRALQGMARDGVVLTMGSGGRADPHRYACNPMVAAVAGYQGAYEAAIAAIENRAAEPVVEPGPGDLAAAARLAKLQRTEKAAALTAKRFNRR